MRILAIVALFIAIRIAMQALYIPIGENMKIYDGETVETVSDAPAVTSMCIHGERLFATEAG